MPRKSVAEISGTSSSFPHSAHLRMEATAVMAEFHADKRRDSDEEMLAALDINIPNYATTEGQERQYTPS